MLYASAGYCMNAFTPKFEHRLSAMSKAGKSITLGDFMDTVLLTCDRATAVLHLLSLQFENENMSKCSAEINAAALHAAIAEIQDIEAFVLAYHEQQCGGADASKGSAI